MNRASVRGASLKALRRLFVPFLLLCLAAPAFAATSLPRLVTKDGRHALFVDGAPFLILGAQANNSSNYPGGASARLADDPRAPRQHARDPGRLGADRAARRAGSISPSSTRFCKQARQNDVRLVLLWFGTWKNTNPQLHARMGEVGHHAAFRAMITPDGKTHLRPFAARPRDARGGQERVRRADAPHLREVDPQHTVIMVQVENETGSYGNPARFLARPRSACSRGRSRPSSRAGSARAEPGRRSSARPPTRPSTPGTSRATSTRSPPPGKAELDLPMYVNAVAQRPLHAKKARSTARAAGRTGT